jgi:protein-disulfide isomerase
MKNKIAMIVGAAVVLIGLFFVGTKMYKGQQTEEISKIAESNADKFMPDYAPRLGPADAKIKLVEFMDPECESCRAFHPHLKSIMKEFEGNIQLIVRYAPFHPNSKLAIKILEGARKQGKYWETMEVLYQYQPQWGSHHDPKPDLMWNYLPEAGVDVEKLKADLVDFSVAELTEKEMKDAKDLGVKGTPTFFVNGKLLETFHPDALREMIRKEIETK